METKTGQGSPKSLTLLQKAFIHWRDLAPKNGQGCCDFGSHRFLTCPREQAWRAYVMIRDNRKEWKGFK